VARGHRIKEKNNRKDGEDEATARETLLDEKASQRILALSRTQQRELVADEARVLQRRGQQRRAVDSDDDDEEEPDDDLIVDDDNEEEEFVIENDNGYVTLAEGAMGLSEEDAALVESMMRGSDERRTLADIILEKIEEKEAEKRGQGGQQQDEPELQLPPKVVEVYTEIGKMLSRYTSGKLPKAFKVIPSLSNWEDVLYLTRPDLWTPQAMYAATRIFASNLNPKMAQRFYNLVLLDSVRADIQRNKKLNYHYYMALKKSVYKPAAFFKGVLLPLCQDSCTLREAAIVASVLQRVSIPVHHSAVAIHKLAQQQDYSGAGSIFIRTLLNKKYSLPAPVIGSLVRHFASFAGDDQDLPVLWHQALLVFVQRYKNEVQDEARESLRLVMRKHFHHKITPEIRRELFGAQAWKDERKGALSVGADGDDMDL
jgi:essential nuclear protein 1